MAGITKWKITLTTLFFLGFLSLLGILFCGENSNADNCRQNFSHSYHYPQQVVREEVYYFVGQPLRIQALLDAERLANDRLRKKEEQEYAEYKRLQAKYSKAGQQQTAEKETPKETNPAGNNNIGPEPVPPDPKPDPLPPEPPKKEETQPSNPINNSTPTLYGAKCTNCHSGIKPKGQLTLAPDITLSPAQYKIVIDQLDFDKMPKGGPPLTSAEKSQIKSELAQLLQ